MVKKKATFAAGLLGRRGGVPGRSPGSWRTGWVHERGRIECNVRGGSARDAALALRYLSGPLQLASLPGVGSDAATTDSPVSPRWLPALLLSTQVGQHRLWHPRTCLGGDDSGLHELDIRCGVEPRAL